jgi:hypothetical protein
MPRIFRSSSATVGFVGAAILAAFALAAFTGTQATAQYYSRALNPQPLPPGRALNPQPLPPGIYAPGHARPAVACRRVCAQTRSLGPATAPQCIRWQTVC